MREILFRGKSVDDGEWLEGFIVLHKERYYILPRKFMWLETSRDMGTDFYTFRQWIKVIPATVGQYTGLNDCNGVKIFEGDIMKTAIGGITQHIGVVEFSNGAFGLRCTDEDAYFLCFVVGSFEVIGNIHDNPELLGGKE